MKGDDRKPAPPISAAGAAPYIFIGLFGEAKAFGFFVFGGCWRRFFLFLPIKRTLVSKETDRGSSSCLQFALAVHSHTCGERVASNYLRCSDCSRALIRSFTIWGENPAASFTTFRQSLTFGSAETVGCRRKSRSRAHWEPFTPHGFPDCLIDSVCIAAKACLKSTSRRPPSAEDVSLPVLIQRVFHRPFEGGEARELHWREGDKGY